MSAARILLFITALVTCGCGDGAGNPTAPTTTSAEPLTVLFSGTLQPRGTRFYSYTLSKAGTVSAMLASLERGPAPVTNSLQLAIGTPAGTGCSPSLVTVASPSLIPQLKQDFAAGTYCVRIDDTEGLPAPLNFTIRVVHP